MYRELLQKATLFALLKRFDQDLADEARRAGCVHCGGPLHDGRYVRKPRGGLALPDDDCERLSLCCGRQGCRRRTLPPYCLFFGRRVYWGVVVTEEVDGQRRERAGAGDGAKLGKTTWVWPTCSWMPPANVQAMLPTSTPSGALNVNTKMLLKGRGSSGASTRALLPFRGLRCRDRRSGRILCVEGRPGTGASLEGALCSLPQAASPARLRRGVPGVVPRGGLHARPGVRAPRRAPMRARSSPPRPDQGLASA